ncbi:MAG: hypothetical protein KKA07_14940 [Bacteroidetes bacterium]|nr:hypothetical protein [Bacteroidota bacterium]MBU1720357.1 hypothetical protein [Bacteroidota bacterium]
MKIIVILLIAAFVGASQPASAANPWKKQKKYFPSWIGKIYIGMKQDDLLKKRSAKVFPNQKSGKVKAVESFDGKEPSAVNEVEYSFSADDNLLIQVVIKYSPLAKAAEIAEKLYGKPNNGKEWLYKISNDLSLKIWLKEDILYIADKKYFF